MSITAPRGGLSLAEHRMALTLANCAEWQAMCAAGDEDQALVHIYFASLPPPANGKDSYTVAEMIALRPFATIFTEERGGGYEIECIAERGWQDSGRIYAVIEDNVDQAIKNDPQEIARQFQNHIGAILGTEDGTVGLTDLAGTSPDELHEYLTIRRIRFAGTFRAAEDEAAGQGDHVYCLLTMDWGLR